MNFLGAFQMDHDIDYPSPDMAVLDGYTFAASAYVLEKATNKSVPIAAFAAREKVDNFVISPILRCARNNFTNDSGTGPITMLLTNWALTIGSIYITLLVVSEKYKMDPGFVLLPVTNSNSSRSLCRVASVWYIYR